MVSDHHSGGANHAHVHLSLRRDGSEERREHAQRQPGDGCPPGEDVRR